MNMQRTAVFSRDLILIRPAIVGDFVGSSRSPAVSVTVLTRTALISFETTGENATEEGNSFSNRKLKLRNAYAEPLTAASAKKKKTHPLA